MRKDTQLFHLDHHCTGKVNKERQERSEPHRHLGPCIANTCLMCRMLRRLQETSAVSSLASSRPLSISRCADKHNTLHSRQLHIAGNISLASSTVRPTGKRTQCLRNKSLPCINICPTNPEASRPLLGIISGERAFMLQSPPALTTSMCGLHNTTLPSAHPIWCEDSLECRQAQSLLFRVRAFHRCQEESPVDSQAEYLVMARRVWCPGTCSILMAACSKVQ